MRTYITQDNNGNIITRAEYDSSDSPSSHSENTEELDKGFDEIMEMLKADSQFITDIIETISNKNYTAFKELMVVRELNTDANDLTKNRIDTFFRVMEAMDLKKNFTTSFKFFTQDDFMHKEHILLALWLTTQDELAYKMMEKRSFDISEKKYDAFFDIFDNKTRGSSYSGLWPDEKREKMAERRHHFLTIHRNYCTYTKLSKDISKMEEKTSKRIKI